MLPKSVTREDRGMRGARMAAWAAGALVAAVPLSGCSGTEAADPRPASTAPSSVSTDLISGGTPSFEGALPVRLASGLRIMGLGCRQTSRRDVCAVDGSQTYT